MTDEKTRQLENRIETLEATIAKMLPGRRDALKLGGAALVGGAAMSGAASAQPGDQDGEAGVIGTDNNPVDIQASDIEVDDLVVNGTASGPIGPALESGDSVTVASIKRDTTDQNFVVLYNGTAKDVLGGTINGDSNHDFLYEFADGTTLRKNGSGTFYSFGNNNEAALRSGGFNSIYSVDFLPPAKQVTKIEVGSKIRSDSEFGAEVILRD